MNNLSSYKGIIVNVSKILIKTGEKRSETQKLL